MTAAEILTVTRAPESLTPAEWLIVIDAIIDRALPDEIIRGLTSRVPFAALSHRWIERQLQSVEKLPPLLPWWIGGRS